MSEPLHLSVPGHAELHLTTSSGGVSVTAEERSDIFIESGAPRSAGVEQDATGRIAVTSSRGGSQAFEVRVPVGSDLVVGTISGSVELRGPLGAVRVTTVSSAISVERAESLDVRSISGSIEVDECSGRCRLNTKSGRATCRNVGEARVTTLSGRILVKRVAGSANVKSASGHIEVGADGGGDIAINTMSGGVRVELPPGVKPHAKLRSLSGRPKNECGDGDDCQVQVNSLSGRIEIVPS